MNKLTSLTLTALLLAPLTDITKEEIRLLVQTSSN